MAKPCKLTFKASTLKLKCVILPPLASTNYFFFPPNRFSEHTLCLPLVNQTDSPAPKLSPLVEGNGLLTVKITHNLKILNVDEILRTDILLSRSLFCLSLGKPSHSVN